MRIVFMGSPEFSVPSLEQLYRSQYEIVAVYTQPDRPAGRGRGLVSPPVKEAALRMGLPVLQPPSLKSEEAVRQLAGLRPEVIVVSAFGQILAQSVLDIPASGCVNVHPSLLPKFRGASPVAGAILSGDDFTGVSIMLLDAGMDTGPVLSQAMVSVSPQDTTGTLTGKLSRVAAHLLEETLINWLSHEIEPQPQDCAGATYTAQITKEEGEIDWNQPAVEIRRRVRAFSPWPGCYTTWRGKQLKIIEATVESGEGTVKAGEVVELSRRGAGPGVGTGDGILGLSRVQVEGKKAITGAEFLRGQRDFTGAVLPS